MTSGTINKKFWRGKKVLITGHTGFKGSWLALWLQSLEADLIGYALSPPTSPSLYIAADLANHMTSVLGDVRDFNLLQDTFKKNSPEIVIHMAAQALVLPSYENPVETYTTNVLGTLYLLEAARHTPSVKVIINVTSDKCYENKESHEGYREKDALGGFDPYSNSKACSELVTTSYRHAFFSKSTTSLASVRAGNVIGGGDWAPHRLIPDFIRAWIDKQALQIRHPQAIRPWQHVLEPLHGYLMLAEKLYHTPNGFAEAWNFGPDSKGSKTVSWIIDALCKHCGYFPEKKITTSFTSTETQRLALNCTKARSKLQWKPRWNLEKSLLEITRWYQAFYNQQNMREFTLAQISAYFEGSRYECKP